MSRELTDPLAGSLGSAAGDPERAALQEIIRLAEEDRRRGVRYWFDPELVTALRDRVRDLSGEPAPSRATSAPPRRVPGRPAATAVPVVVPSPVPEIPPAPAEVSGAAPEDVSLPAAAPAPHPPIVEAPRPPVASANLAAPSHPDAARPGAPRPVWGPPAEAVGRADNWREQLAALGAGAAGCTACGLCATRTKVVFGIGSGVVPLVFVGEAPGHDEDLTGEPFVGRAGQLLTKIIEAIGLTREQVYICNVLKCRPPQNRNPLPDEIACCRHFLESQLELLRPKVICTLGLFAAQLLLDSPLPIGKLRGRLNTDGRWPILPTFHPAYLLRNPSAKATVWEDVQLVRRILDA